MKNWCIAFILFCLVGLSVPEIIQAEANTQMSIAVSEGTMELGVLNLTTGHFITEPFLKLERQPIFPGDKEIIMRAVLGTKDEAFIIANPTSERKWDITVCPLILLDPNHLTVDATEIRATQKGNNIKNEIYTPQQSLFSKEPSITMFKTENIRPYSMYTLENILFEYTLPREKASEDIFISLMMTMI